MSAFGRIADLFRASISGTSVLEGKHGDEEHGNKGNEQHPYHDDEPAGSNTFPEK
jgi:hypothetical protein